MPKMRAAQVARAGGPFEIIERDLPQPAAGWVRIKVEACGICHSDSLVKEGHWPGLQYPRVPGHEVVGVVDDPGESVTQWKPGQRVGVGWHGGHCGYCDACRRGDFFGCQVSHQVTGISFDGGYAEYMTAPGFRTGPRAPYSRVVTQSPGRPPPSPGLESRTSSPPQTPRP